MSEALFPSSAAPERDDDAALASRIVGGDRSAFVELMRHYNRRLYRLARATLREDAEAEDALQEAYLCAFRRMGQYRGDAALGTWLSRLVLNECLGRLRRRARRDNVVQILSATPEMDLDNMATSNEETPHGAHARAEMRSLLERKLDELPQSFRTVFVLRCVEEMSVEDTAAALDLPEATVRTRLFRARSLLRESLARDIDLAERDLFEFGGATCDRVIDRVLERLRRSDGSPG